MVVVILLSLSNMCLYSYVYISMRPLNCFSSFLLAEAASVMSYPSLIEVDNKFSLLENPQLILVFNMEMRVYLLFIQGIDGTEIYVVNILIYV